MVATRRTTVHQQHQASSRQTNVLSSTFTYTHAVLTNLTHINHLIIYLIIADTLLSTLIVRFVPYTEIDWSTYMQQLNIVTHKHETNYINISGSTGPLVYPAFHLYIFAALSALTNNGSNIRRAQYIFELLYLVYTGIVCLAYKNAITVQTTKSDTPTSRIPQYILIPLILSKRIHSIFMLRLFNDCIAMLLLHTSILLFQQDQWSIGCVLYSLGVGTKMNVLLFAPALLYLLLMRFDIAGTVRHLAICATVQLIIGAPFLATYPVSYLSKAFELSRQFFYIWTVNWRMLPEHIFLSKTLSVGLLVLHLSIMLYLLHRMLPHGLTQIVRNSYTRYTSKTQRRASNPSPFTILTLMYVTNFVGIVFARSLHYQFYVWYYHTLPLLLYLTQMPLLLCVAVMVCIEYSWNVFPATPFSSSVLLAAHLVILLCLIRTFTRVNVTQLERQLESTPSHRPSVAVKQL